MDLEAGALSEEAFDAREEEILDRLDELADLEADLEGDGD
jgi:hypothetical protein